MVKGTVVEGRDETDTFLGPGTMRSLEVGALYLPCSSHLRRSSSVITALLLTEKDWLGHPVWLKSKMSQSCPLEPNVFRGGKAKQL